MRRSFLARLSGSLVLAVALPAHAQVAPSAGTAGASQQASPPPAQPANLAAAQDQGPLGALDH